MEEQIQDPSDQVIYEQAINIGIGDHIVIDKVFPCRIMEKHVSKTGKHGGCKISFVGIDIFTQKKHTTIYRTGDKVVVPIITKEDYQLVGISDEDPPYLSLVSDKQELREDLRLVKDEMGSKIIEDYNNGKDIIVTTQKALNQESVVSYKINK
ncbi:mimivirus translation initiation factor 5A [Tupanvirus deep ocean]|uniref:Mimivirus translation initiation factor 5A n=2 Tax=Tupanvirus TaxID=2094720 RepID=A0AC62A729_9VIRU|nr:mimivirus translation initiation factor 5A [Tupanvirus deep ocean]QKU33581.1 mimivirus translation initiation factor 5A [Tupanvirus deep ocean]